MLIGTDGSRKATLADSTIINLLEGPDPRFSMQAPLPKSFSTTTGGLTSTLTTTRTAPLANPNDLLSLTKLTDTVTLNGRTFKSVYDAATKTATSTSAAGRQSNAVIDSLGRVVQSQITAHIDAWVVLPDDMHWVTLRAFDLARQVRVVIPFHIREW